MPISILPLLHSIILSVVFSHAHAFQSPVPSTLTPLQQASQRVIWSYSGLSPPSTLLSNISAGNVAGIIFFGGNIGSNLSAVVKQLNAANILSPVQLPLLLMTDQEGGEIRRLPGAPTLSAKEMGAATDPATESSTQGTAAAKNLLSYGLNINLAPILGVYRASGDFLDYYERSFSESASVVTSASTAFIEAQQSNGVAATAKHFPGLGAALHTQNTDSVPVTLNLSNATLRSIDEVPYSSAINTAKVQLVMPSWAIYPALSSLPSGLSSYWLQTELRGRLGFQGVTISDAIEAGALASFGTYGQRAVLAANAGIDLVLASVQDVNQGWTIVKALEAALKNGTISTTASQAAVQRVTLLRESFA